MKVVVVVVVVVVVMVVMVRGRFGREYTDRGIIELSMPCGIVPQHLMLCSEQLLDLNDTSDYLAL